MQAWRHSKIRLVNAAQLAVPLKLMENTKFKALEIELMKQGFSSVKIRIETGMVVYGN